MRNLIAQTIKDNWDNDVFESIKMKHFFRRIKKIYNILTFLEVTSSTKVGIYGNNSSNWVAVYIATLLKGCTLVIIPPYMTRTEMLHYMVSTEVNHLFLDTKDSSIINTFKKESLLPLQTVFNMNTLETILIPSNMYNALIDMNIILNEELYSKELLLENDYPNDVETIITPTLGTQFAEQKFVVHSSTSIMKFLESASKEMPFKQFDKLQISASYSRFHLVNVLIPFIKGCVITNNKDDADYFIESTESFERMWKYIVQPMFYRRLYSKLLSKKSWYWLYRIVVLLILRKHYNLKHSKGIMILNNEIHEGAMSILRNSGFPLFSTYGSQETNQLVAINDYSTISLRKQNCVGAILDNYTATIVDKEVCLISDSIFNKYHDDERYSEHVTETGWYKTGDIGKISGSGQYLSIYGRKNSYYKGDDLTLDELERLIRGLPFVQESILFISDDELYLSVYLDRNFIESKEWGYIKSKQFLVNFRETINTEIKPDIKIKQISISPNPFEKTFDGSIRKYLYRNVIG